MTIRLKSLGMVALLAGTFVLAAWVRSEAARDPLWIDEYLSGWTVADAWSEAGRRGDQANQAPAYTWLLLAATRLGGLSPAVIRAPSLLGGLLVVGVSVWFAWRVTGRDSAAILAGFLAAIDPNFVFYASEARPYALVQLCGLISSWSLIEWLCLRSPANDRPRIGWAIGWSSAAIAMFYLHYTSSILIALQCIVGSVIWLRAVPKSRAWPIAVAIVLLACLPGIVAVLQIYGRANDWQAVSSAEGFVHALHTTFVCYLGPAVLGFLWSLNVRRKESAANRALWLALSSLLAGSIATIWFLASYRLAPLGHYRYAIAGLGLGPVVATCLLGLVPRRFERVALASIVALIALSQTTLGEHASQGILQSAMRFERWDEVAAAIAASDDPEFLPVVVMPNLIEDSRMRDLREFPRASYFYAPLVVFNSLDDRQPIWAAPTWKSGRFSDDLVQAIEQAGGVWLVIRGGRAGTEIADRLELSILNDLRSRFADSKWSLHFEHRGPMESDVQLLRVQLTRK